MSNETIFVIVENMFGVDENGNDDVFELVCPGLGYFVDENKAEAKVNMLNKNYCEDKKREGQEVTEDDETRFGFIPLDNCP
jgi:hypothetical protein